MSINIRLFKTPIFLLSAIAAFWAWALFSDFRYRAFDAADPFIYSVHAFSALDAYKDHGWAHWLASVVEDRSAKPMVKAFYSLAVIFGANPGVSVYYLILSIAVILFFVISAWVLWRAFNPEAAYLYAALCAASNLLLGYALHGPNTWIGMAFFWAALAFSYFFKKRWGKTVFGICLALAVMSSSHVIPFSGAALVLAFWHEASAGGSWLKRLRLWWRAAAPAILAMIGIPALLSTFAYFLIGRGFFQMALDRSWEASTGGNLFPAGHGYLFDFLIQSEARGLLVFVFAASALGLFYLFSHMKKELFSADEAAPVRLILLAAPLCAIIYLESGSLVKLGRTYLPLVPFFFAWAAYVSSEAVRRLEGKKSHAGTLSLAGFCAVLFFAASERRWATWQAFHAGHFIEEVLKTQGGGPVIMAGVHQPYIYMPDEDPRDHMSRDRATRVESNLYGYSHNTRQRALLLQNLLKNFQTGNEWVLVSYFSNWRGLYFIDNDPNILPIQFLYSSGVPYIEVPGVESTEFFRFINEAIYDGIRKKTIPFPAKNRLYRSGDLINFLFRPDFTRRGGN